MRSLVISSKLDYCNALLYGLPDAQLQRLQRAQNTAARIVTRTKKSEHITPVLKQLHWLPVRHRIVFKLLLITYKSLNGLSPQYLRNLITPRSSSRTLRSSDKCLLHTPRWNLTTYGRRSFSSAAPVLWNSLPLDIKTSPNVNTFKRRLKSHIFQRAFP